MIEWKKKRGFYPTVEGYVDDLLIFKIEKRISLFCLKIIEKDLISEENFDRTNIHLSELKKKANKVYDLIKNENQAIQVLKVAEQEIKYRKNI